MQVLGIVIATLPVYIRSHEIVKSWPINGGIIAMGAFIGLVALFGCYGSRQQSQVILFFVSFQYLSCFYSWY